MMSQKTILPEYVQAPHFKHFWEKGTGSKLIEWSRAEVNMTRFQEFAPLYYKTDELGDKVIHQFYASKPYAAAAKEMEKYLRYGIPENAEIPQAVQKLIHYSEQVPIGSTNASSIWGPK